MKRETKAEKRHRLITSLSALGFTFLESQTLRRIEMTLHRWSEHECNGNIQREGERGDGRPRFHSGYDPKGRAIPYRERGALRRLSALIATKPELVSYHQGDPRGCALYVGRKPDLGDLPIDQAYTRLVAVCD